MAPAKRPSAATIDDVARRAGVSISTVSRVINRTVPVSDEVIARVQAAMAELRYQPRAAARNLATRRTNTLGLLLTDISGDFFTPLLSGIERVASEEGFDLLIATSRQTARDGIPRSLGVHNTDGLLVFADGLGEPGLRHYHELGLPVVLIHRSPPSGLDFPCVTVENKAASRRLVEHLIVQHGRRRIAFLCGPEAQEDSYWREQGYREALAAAGLPFDAALLSRGDFSRHVAEASVRDMISAGVAVDAIFAGDDESAVGVLTALRAAGRRVPEDVSVVGFDDQWLAAYLSPPLTTVRAPTEEVGRQATLQLLSLIRTGRPEQPLTLLPTSIVLRESCGCKA